MNYIRELVRAEEQAKVNRQWHKYKIWRRRILKSYHKGWYDHYNELLDLMLHNPGNVVMIRPEKELMRLDEHVEKVSGSRELYLICRPTGLTDWFWLRSEVMSVSYTTIRELADTFRWTLSGIREAISSCGGEPIWMARRSGAAAEYFYDRRWLNDPDLTQRCRIGKCFD